LFNAVTATPVNVEEVKAQLKKCSPKDVNYERQYCDEVETSLTMAARDGLVEVVQLLLLVDGIDVNWTTLV